MKENALAGLRAQVERLWQRGELLRALARRELAEEAPAQLPPDPRAPDWPLRLKLKTPDAAELTHQFEKVRLWVNELKNISCINIQWHEWTHRVHGRQRLPESVWLDTPAQALAFVHKSEEGQLFLHLCRQTLQTEPALLPWLMAHPLRALPLAECWHRLLSVVGWVKAHPNPGIYLRQVDIPAVDSKFIEKHLLVLSQWLNCVLPGSGNARGSSDLSVFARSYGFRDKPLRIRFRLLDESLSLLPGCTGLTDITLDAGSFVQLKLPAQRVFITENEVNFLAFPAVEKALVIFGAGYGWNALSHADWLHQRPLAYWGDLDTHGFAILDGLRKHFPHTTSLLMDRDTLLAHKPLWGQEPQGKRHLADLSRLTQAESDLYDDLRLDRLGIRIRLEQEHIAYGWLCQRLQTRSVP